jgi:CheY-like chemotaxis protein
LDLILSDIKMPMMAGLGFVRQLRASEDDQHVPVVMITTEAGEALALAQRGGVGIARMIMHHFSPRLRSEYCSEKAGWTFGR